MKQAESLTLAEIDDMNRAATDAATRDPALLRRLVSAPEDDLDIFFSNIQGKRMLDIGCGWGYYASRFQQFGLEYLGIDYSEKMVALAQSANPTMRFVVGNYRQLCLPDESLDAIWSCCSLHYGAKRHVQTALAEFYRVLAPGGIACLVEPNMGVSDEFLGMSNFSDNKMYFTHWFPHEFLEVLCDSAFCVLESVTRPEHGSMTFLVRKE